MMTQREKTGEDAMLRVRNAWWIVAACVCGLVCSGGPINVWTFSVFLKPVADSLHIGRSDLAGALAVAGVVSACLPPLVGFLLDKFGSRPVILTGIVVFASVTAMQSLMTASPYVIYPLMVARQFGSAFCSPTSYSFVVARWFDQHRGLAMGIALAGVGLGTSIIPLIASFLIGHFDWRTAYIGIGIVILIIAGIPVTLFVREPDAVDRAKMPHLTNGEFPGVTLREAMTSSWRFWAMALAFSLGIIVLNGTLTQIVSILSDRGMTLPEATSVLTLSGLAAIAGRLLSGWLLDRFPGRYVAIGFFTILAIGVAILGSGLPDSFQIVAAILCGLANGAEIDLMGYFVSRYFGLKYYGRIMGMMTGAFQASIGVGPLLSTKSFDLYHSYLPALQFYEVITLVAIAIFALLGPYAYPTVERPMALRHKVPA